MLVVLALGGNALLQRGEKAEAEVQHRNVKIAAKSIAEVAKEHKVVLTHGNGPQVGLLALQADAYKDVNPYPLDVLGAQTQGMIGYLMDQELENLMPTQRIAVLVTQVEVDPKDPAFKNPAKPIGPVYSKEVAEKLAQERGWVVAPDGQYFRRVVPSPLPLTIVEQRTIRLLVDNDVLVVCAGGGGAPVMMTEDGVLRGVEAVIDKDMTGSLLSQEIKADAFLVLTDVAAVCVDWGTPNERKIKRAAPEHLRQMGFAKGSMGPKVEAACQFVEKTGGIAGIGSLADAPAILKGKAGTMVDAKCKEIEFY